MWRQGRPLPGSVEEAAQKIERIMDLQERQKRRAPARHGRPAEQPYVASSGLLNPALMPPTSRLMGRWATTVPRPPSVLQSNAPAASVLPIKSTARLPYAAAEPRYRPREAGSEPDRAPLADEGAQLALRDTQSGDHACLAGYLTCLSYGERLYDLGYVANSHELYRNCRTTYAQCLATEDAVQTNPRVRAALTSFPPEKARNGGGSVWHEKGRKPTYVPPSFDPLADIPRQ